MLFILDSWLDNKVPSIRVINKETGQSVLEFKGEEVQRLLEAQIIDTKTLFFRDSMIEKENVNELFAYAKQTKKILQEKSNRMIVSDSWIRMKWRSGALVNTYNRFDFLRKSLLLHKSFNFQSV